MSASAARTSSALSLQNVEIRAEDADDDRLASPGQDLANALLQIGLHIAVEAGIALHHFLDLGIASCRSRRLC